MQEKAKKNHLFLRKRGKDKRFQEEEGQKETRRRTFGHSGFDGGLMGNNTGAIYFNDEIITNDADFTRFYEFDGTLMPATIYAERYGISFFKTAFTCYIFHVKWYAADVGSTLRRIVTSSH